jgi:hypothetical protein
VTENNEGHSISFCSQNVSHQSLTWGTTLRSAKVIFYLFKKLWTEKYPSSRFNHLYTTYASIRYSNIGISKFICTLKGVVCPFEEDESAVGSCQRICTKLSIISFLCCMRDSSINIFKGSHLPSSFFSPTMRGRLGVREILSSRETSSRPMSLYSNLVGEMH